MELFLVRHAIAVPRGNDALDHARPLTAKGRSRFEAEVRALADLGVTFDRVFHSPWTRAVQTAELLSPLLDGTQVTVEGLAASPEPALLEAFEGRAAAVVGHEPWMGELLALLVTGDVELGERFRFKKGGIAHLEGEPRPGGCTLQALYPPKPLRRLAAG